jgi:hypothetical protein
MKNQDTLKKLLLGSSLVAASLLTFACGSKNSADNENNLPTEKNVPIDLGTLENKDEIEPKTTDISSAHALIGSIVVADKIANSGLNTDVSSSGTCLTGSKPNLNVLEKEQEDKTFSPNGQTVEFTHKRIKSLTDLRKSLKVEAGASGYYGGVVAQSNTDYFSSQTITNDNQMYFYKISVDNPPVTMKNIKLTEEALNILKYHGLQAFYRHCGKKAVIGYKTGGYLFSVINIAKKSQNTKETLETEIEASGFGFDIDGKLKKSSQVDLKNLDVSVYGKWSGGLGVRAETELTKLRELSETWPKTVSKNSVVTELITMPYAKIISSFIDEDYELVQSELKNYYFQLDRLINMKRIIATNTTYNGTVVSKIGFASITQLDTLITELARSIKFCKKTSELKDCQNSELLFSARDFRLRVIKKHPSCGVLEYKRVLKRHASCGKENFTVTENKEHRSCGVSSWNIGVLKSKTVTQFGSIDLKKHCKIDKRKGFTGTKTSCKHIRSGGRRGGPDFDFPEISESCKVTCKGPSSKFGVKKYKSCNVKTTQQRNKSCPVATKTPLSYKACLVAID